jgi:hypothetical protein
LLPGSRALKLLQDALQLEQLSLAQLLKTHGFSGSCSTSTFRSCSAWQPEVPGDLQHPVSSVSQFYSTCIMYDTTLWTAFSVTLEDRFPATSGGQISRRFHQYSTMGIFLLSCEAWPSPPTDLPQPWSRWHRCIFPKHFSHPWSG